MTYVELRALVWTWVDDVNGDYFTATEVNRSLNNALYEVQKQLIGSGESWYLRSQESDTVAEQEAYELPSDFMRLHRFDIVPSGTGAWDDPRRVLTPVTPVQAMDFPVGPALPVSYYTKKNCVVLRPIPDQAYPIRILYSYRASEMSGDSDTPDVPIQYQEYLAVLACIDCFLRDQRDPAPFFAKREMYLQSMKADADQRNVDSPRMVVTTEDDGWELYY